MTAKYAILIGVDGYEFAPLDSAVRDAVALRAALTAEPRPMFGKSDQITLLTTLSGAQTPAESSGPATREAILDALKVHYLADDPADFLLVYFAGHGMVTSNAEELGRETLILPSDVTGPEDGRNMICLDTLLAAFAERGPLQQLWIIDACRDMPYQRRPRGYALDWHSQPSQALRRRVTLYAVAQGGNALSIQGGQGRFTGFLIEALAGRGAAVDYVPGRGHCVTAHSIHEYIRRRIDKELEIYDDWTQTVQSPQLVPSGKPLDPLRNLPLPPPRDFEVRFHPPHSARVVDVALEIEPGLPTKGWPPRAPPRIYELRASLRPGMEAAGWGTPSPALRVVDLREEDWAQINVPFNPPPRRPGNEPLGAPSKAPSPLPHTSPAVTTGERGISRATTSGQTRQPGSGATLRVDSVDKFARIHLQQAESPWHVIEARPGEVMTVDPGAWNVLIKVGDLTTSATRVLLAGGESRTISATAQITPAAAAVLPAIGPASDSPASIMPSETIGPMQGAVLATLLPLFAIKPFDVERNTLHSFDHLKIPLVSAADYHQPFAVAVAFEGQRRRPLRASVRRARLHWEMADGRVLLFIGEEREPDGTIAIDTDNGAFNIAAPSLERGVTAITATFWPQGRIDFTAGIFRRPIGYSWGEPPWSISVGKIARALAVAAPLFRAGERFDQVGEEVIADAAHAKWYEPLLGALAFHALDRQPSGPGYFDMRETIRANMPAFFGHLPDSRVISALDLDPNRRRDLLKVLLDDRNLGQPALTASLARLARLAIELGAEDHWSVRRLDRIEPGQVFNVIRVSPKDPP